MTSVSAGADPADRTRACAAPPDTVRGFRVSLADHEPRAALEACRALPVVVVCSARDRLLPPSHSRAIADAFPSCRLVLCPDAGHMLPLERPDEVTSHLAALVREAEDTECE
ncbi:MAG: alpha/beta fold hydrolase [Thermobispora bispora]|nr:alpha/beta fold hydrolase [Thermobispora bispora]